MEENKRKEEAFDHFINNFYLLYRNSLKKKILFEYEGFGGQLRNTTKVEFLIKTNFDLHSDLQINFDSYFIKRWEGKFDGDQENESLLHMTFSF